VLKNRAAKFKQDNQQDNIFKVIFTALKETKGYGQNANIAE
jgi:hypothetical protein